MRDGEGAVAGEFFGENGRGNFVEAGATVGFGNAATEQADFSGFFEHLGHEMFIFVRFQLGDRRHHFFLHEFFGGLAYEALIIGKIRRCEDILGTAGSDEESAAAIEDL